MHLEGGFQSDVFLSLHVDGPINVGGGAYKKQLKEQYPVTLLRMYQPLIF